ncbi:hypothetical protein Droror1_Dr00002388 [Drosera rotundifolia]
MWRSLTFCLCSVLEVTLIKGQNHTWKMSTYVSTICTSKLVQLEICLLPVHFMGFVVVDGHGVTDAASFSRKNILKFIVEDTHFPSGIKKAVRNAFVKADHAFADSTCLDNTSGTTVLTTLILGMSRH